MENSDRPPHHLATPSPPRVPHSPLHHLPLTLVPHSSHPTRTLSPLLPKIHFPPQHGKIKTLSPRWRQLFIRSHHFMANFASFLAVFRLENDLIPDSLLGVCGTVVDSRREGLRAVVYVGKAVFIGVCQSHESIISYRELGGRVGRGGDGVEGVCDLCVHLRGRTLFGPVRDALSAVVRRLSDPGTAAAGFLLVCGCAERGELGLEVYKWNVRCGQQNALLSGLVPFHIPGNFWHAEILCAQILTRVNINLYT